MSAYVWLSSDNRTKYMTSIPNDPIPLGLGYHLTSGSDGAPDAALKTLEGNLMSGGYPAYNGYDDPGSTTNGILGGNNR